jgi:predicted ATPase
MLLYEVRATNLLSFGPRGLELKLQPLNVLIGPNGSGKSNLIEAIGLLAAAPKHLAASVRDGGGIRDWIWKGDSKATARLEAVVDNPAGTQSLRHAIAFRETAQKFELVDERIEDEPTDGGNDLHYVYYQYQHGRPVMIVRDGTERQLHREDVSSDESILSQRKDPDQYPEITHLAQGYARIGLYREWFFGRFSTLRQPNDLLAPDCENLGLVLNRLRRDAVAKRDILENLKQLYAGIEDFDVSIEGGTVQVFFEESGFTIPATRLSDGTLRYLCLLAVLCNPAPPPLVCIEEPELGLHPDILPTLAKLLKQSSQRMQLIVTTHSDILVDELSDTPEAVVVCEKHDGQTTMSRLDPAKLTEWLEKYRLGQLWTQGELGGVRW